ncbi:MAG: calcium-binding protein [Pirellulaceae bacterium]|nr:hypothetical protein [Planctomycetales bacterium]
MKSRPFGLESLEQKTLLAADVMLQTEDGNLSIIGTPAADIVHIAQEGDVLSVSINGQEPYTLDATQVASIYFEGASGDDEFINNSSIPSVAYGNRGNDRLVGGSAADELHGGPGYDVIDGNDGDDSLHGDYGNDIIHGGRGNDSVYGWHGNDELYGDEGDDYLSGFRGHDKVYGGTGNDILKGHEGNDELYGDDGDDLLYGWMGHDLLVGGNGNDYLSGWSGNDILLGGRGNDRLWGHAGRDLLIGGVGGDTLKSGTGEDINISGSTVYDNDPDALDKVLAAWDTEGSSYDRADRLFKGEDGAPLVNFSTVKNDGTVDVFIDDETELDWFLYERKDVFVDE